MVSKKKQKLDKFGLKPDSTEITAPSPRSKKCSIAFHRIMNRRDAIKGEAIEAIRIHGPKVREELDIIAALPHDVRSRCAAAFAVLSPQCDFKPNCNSVPSLLEALDAGVPWKIVQDAIRGTGHTMNSEKKCLDYIRAKHIICNATAGEITFDNVKSYVGYGDKTSSMYCALYNEWLPVQTLDTWMLSGMLGDLTGTLRNKVTYTAESKAYAIFRDMLLEIASELDVSPFMLQFSLWLYYRGNKFESHLPIFGLEPLV